MDKIDWKRKLTSRKMWTAIAEFVGMLIIAFGYAQETATQVAAIIMAGAGVIAYIIGEGLVDAASAEAGWTYEDTHTFDIAAVDEGGDVKQPPDGVQQDKE